MAVYRFARRLSPLALALLVIACGSGGTGGVVGTAEPEAGAANGTSTSGSESSAGGVSISGRVADGYIVGAKVCVDLNDNESCDADEPFAITSEGGVYDLEVPEGAENKSIVADIPAEAVDEDTGEAIGKPLVFIAPADRPEFVSPITTLVHQELRANPSLALEDAESAVKSILGIDHNEVSLFTDYVARGQNSVNEDDISDQFRYLHDAARVVASLMKDIEDQVLTAASSSGVDVDGDRDIQRAIRDIVRTEVRDLLPQIAQQVAAIVSTAVSGDGSTGGTESSAERFDPAQLALALRPVDAGDNVQDRIDAVKERNTPVQANIREVLTEGVYWLEFECDYYSYSEQSVDDTDLLVGNELDDDNDGRVSSADGVGDESADCKPVYGHAQLNDDGRALISENYAYDRSSGAWVEDNDDGEVYIADYSLVNGEWLVVESAGPEGLVEFSDAGNVASVSNDEGVMHLKAVDQALDGSPVIKHFWEDDADPIWFDLLEPTDMFSAGSVAHIMSVRQEMHPYRMFNNRPLNDVTGFNCDEFGGNCNVVRTITADSVSELMTLDALRESSLYGTRVISHSLDNGQGTLMKFTALSPEDGSLPIKGEVRWESAAIENREEFDVGKYQSSIDSVGEFVDGTGNEGYQTLPANSPEGSVECSDFEIVESQELTDTDEGKLSIPGDVDIVSLAAAQNIDALDPSLLQLVTGAHPPALLKCEDLAAHTGEYQESSEVTGIVPSDLVDQNGVDRIDMNREVPVSTWEFITVQGVPMIEVQIPRVLRHDSGNRGGQTIVLTPHEGFVRLGVKMPQSYIERVFTYNETAFTTLRSIVESGMNGTR